MLKPDTLALTGVLGLLTALGPMSTDMYLPSLPAIGRALEASPSAAQLTLSVFLAGFAVGQIVYGPVSDRVGRRPVLIAGLCLYAAASLLCAAAWSIETLIAARFVQALGASGPIVLARSIVRDLYDGDRAGQEFSRMGTVMGVVPTLAPVIGGFLEVGFGWRASFAGALLLAAVALILVVTRLPETLRQPAAMPLSLRRILSGFAALGAERHFRLHALLVSATYGGLFAFISGSSFVLQGQYGLGEVHYGLAFGLCAAAYVSGTFAGRGLVGRVGMRRAIGVGAGCLAAGGIAMVLALGLGPHHALGIILPMMVYMIGVGIAFPLAQAAALMPYPDRAGAASSLIGVVQMTAGALVGVAVGAGVAASAWPLAIAVGGLGLVAFGAERLIARAAPPEPQP